jgi:hypothetical protein
MTSIYGRIVISEPKVVKGMKFYIRDGKLCMYIDHGDGSGYLESRIERWGRVTEMRMMNRPEMRGIIGW